jgi:uncharacterized membrane protein
MTAASRAKPYLKDVRTLGTAMASVGGAGTFDGIVLSGIVAAYLT